MDFLGERGCFFAFFTFVHSFTCGYFLCFSFILLMKLIGNKKNPWENPNQPMDFKTIKKKSLLDSEPNQNNFKFLGVLF